MSKETILIVEDEAIVAADLAGKLKRLGYGISDTLDTGESAVSAARARRPDLILMDIRLSGAMDGVDAAEIIRRELDLPVIFLTAHSDSATLERAKLTGPFGYILKPFEERELTTAIEMALFKHRAERSLRESEGRLKLFIEYAPAGLAMFDRDMRYLYASRRWLQDYGLGDRDLTGLSHYEVFPEIGDAWKEAHRRGLAGEVLRSEADRFERADGSVQWVQWELRPWHDAGGNIGGIVIFTEVITDRKRTEEALLRSNQRLDLLAVTASQLLMSESPQQAVNALCQNALEFLDCQAFFNFLVDEKAGCLHLNACGGIPDEEAKKIEWLDYGVAVCGCAARDNCRIVAEEIPNTPDQRTELVKAYGIRAYACHPLVAKGRVLGTLSFGTRTRDRFSEDDLALMKAIADHVAIAMERKRVEDELRQAKVTAEEASRAKSEFVANMSHEIRTPMTVFLMAIEQLLQINADPASRQLLEMADKAAKALRGLVDDILDFSRIEAGSVEIADEPFNPGAGLREVIEMFALTAREKSLSLTLNVSPDVPPIIFGDWFRIRQVLINLIDNAVKFTPQGNIDVTVRTEGEQLVYAVADTGIGIPENMHQQIFESFRQVDASFHRQYGGSGLGLAICKGLVELMGGRIDVKQRERGIVFSFTLPLKTPEASSQPTTGTNVAEVCRDANHARILLVDDDPMILEVINLALTLRGWQTETAVSGAEAIEKWQLGNFNVILMDLQMPGMNGLEAARTIRRDEVSKGSCIPIIGFTAHAGAAILDDCRSAGMDLVLFKPVKIDELYASIDQLLRQ